MKGINKELSAKIAAEVKVKNLLDDARDLIERRRPTTRAAIEEIEDDIKLKASLDLDLV